MLVAYKGGRLHKDFVEMITAKVDPVYSACSSILALNFYQIERYINSGLYRYMSNEFFIRTDTMTIWTKIRIP